MRLLEPTISDFAEYSFFLRKLGATVGGYTLLKPLPSDLGSTYLGIRMSREYHLGVYTSQATDSGSRGSETRNQTYE